MSFTPVEFDGMIIYPNENIKPGPAASFQSLSSLVESAIHGEQRNRKELFLNVASGWKGNRHIFSITIKQNFSIKMLGRSKSSQGQV